MSNIALVKKKYLYLIENFFSANVIAGFTDPSFPGIIPEDLPLFLDFAGKSLRISYLKQSHSARVNLIGKKGVYKGDGIFTGERGLVLVVQTADCLPLYFSRENDGVVGVVHMGWRSAKQEILRNIPFDLSAFSALAGVGLRKCCYRVGRDFLNYKNLRQSLEKRESFYFDPIKFCQSFFVQQGLKKENFCDLAICSLCSKRGFFSYRRDQTKKRMFSFIVKV
ncbi:MAG: polyphenol oxidase family protein [Candidatus Omnitrophota bacterium]